MPFSHLARKEKLLHKKRLFIALFIHLTESYLTHVSCRYIAVDQNMIGYSEAKEILKQIRQRKPFYINW